METTDTTEKDFSDDMDIRENIEQAVHDCEFLRGDIARAYSVACVKNPALGILLYDVISDLAKIQKRISTIKSIT
jgi:hypothetical protein